MRHARLVPVLVAAACAGEASSSRDVGAADQAPEAVADAEVASGADVAAGDARPFSAITCPEVAGTAMSLREKAERFDALARRWHLPAGQDLWFSVLLGPDLETVERVDMSDNVGTWTALYAASQAFRYATTRDPEALGNLRRVVRGEHDMLRITGVRGLFTRAFVNPALPGFPSEEWLAGAYPDCDLAKGHCKRYNRVKEGEFAGFWFKNDVSKDEYAAHMFSMAVAWELVDDPDVRSRVEDIVRQVGDHLIEHGLRITDIDGQVTTYGHLNAMGMDDFPGFNAILALSFMKLAAVVGGGKYADFYSDCLLQRSGEDACIPEESPRPYTHYLDTVGLDLGCKTNWNNHNMAELGMYALLRHESDPELLATYRAALRDALWNPDDERPMRVQENTLYTFFYLVNKDPSDPWPEDEARAAICTMKRYPEHKAHFAVDTLSRYEQVCTGRSDEPMTDVVIPIDERKADNFQWIGNPYALETSPADPRHVESPEDFLLAYWMGRYFGFIDETM